MSKSDLPILLVVEDDEGLQRQLKWAYEDYQVVAATDRKQAIELLRLHEPAVVTLDLGLPPDPDGTTEGFATLAEIQALKPDTKIIVASGHGARESALKAVALGAYDFYRKPVDIDELGHIVKRAFQLHEIEAENRRLENEAGESKTVLGSIVSASPEMLKVAHTIERVASADVSVMLLGASGTGKELLARAVHDQSPRKDGEFVALNCAAIPENLLEAELFGYERGAFTGAVKTTPGKIEMAQGGTLFLDEVGDIPLPLQVKLLRFLQERVIERIGGRKAIDVDTRIVCATHRDLDAMCAEGSFREDLYYRLAEIVVPIPPLSQRTGDAVLLARYFVSKYAKELGRNLTGLAPDAVEAIDEYPWPGNVRELENRVKRAVIMSDAKLVSAGDLDLQAGVDSEGEASPINLRAAREIADRRAIKQALTRTENNISGAAKLLGISRPTLYDLIKQYKMSA
ncbi:PEP-CTERM-box response regulator transcription factor [Sphingomicrobium sediminis]|uniref:PEP-CTERM-box response regulator transcription factor n=1 Tax=Sphingomicrobium sediminis TaxID=2950949 RepID=A0A9X2J1S0_9SPHN|nr:PEP-CTERM-box response regulator transcription factor [Sphingomicrobium sediminis]MCM8556270.1 PEP-CTERM-box response regulator transcription factor [Sphingomicrobium sediminis]